MWSIFSSVTNFPNVTNFQISPIFPSMTRFTKYEPIFQEWPTLSSVTQFSKCDSFFDVWLIS